MEENVTEKSLFNLSQALIFEIQGLLGGANRCYLHGQIEGWFWHLKAVKMRFIQALNDDERKKLRAIEFRVTEALKNQNRDLAAYETENYNEILFDLMEKYDLLLKKKEDRTRIV